VTLDEFHHRAWKNRVYKDWASVTNESEWYWYQWRRRHERDLDPEEQKTLHRALERSVKFVK
jgi:hypothetical protein